MTKKSILFITTQLPYPPKSGGTIKSWNYLKDLCSRYNIGIASLLKNDDEEHLEEFKTQLSFVDGIYEKQNAERNIFNLIKSYLGFPCLNVFRNYSKSFEEKVSVIAQNYDAILIDHYEVFQYIPANYKGKIILHTHNAEFEIWSRMIKLSSNPLIKLALSIEAKRVLQYEKKIIKISDLIYASPSDIASYKSKGISSQKIKATYHLGNDELMNLEAPQFNKTEKALLFMGTLSWEPNIDGLLWFIEEVYPLLLKKHPKLTFYILGKEADSRLPKATQAYPSIELCGFVEEIASFLQKSRVFLAPLRFGGGMKVKVLEGLYSGVPIVTTDVGAEGLELENGEELLIANEPIEFAEKCSLLLENEALWTKLQINGRKKAAEKYTWQPLLEQMDQELHKTLHQ